VSRRNNEAAPRRVGHAMFPAPSHMYQKYAGNGTDVMGVEEVEKRQRPEGILERAAEALDLPGDVVAGLPRLEITGFRELRMENHQGILSYSTEEIRVSGGRSEVIVAGSGLTLRAMNSRELLITGEIKKLEFSD